MSIDIMGSGSENDSNVWFREDLTEKEYKRRRDQAQEDYINGHPPMVDKNPSFREQILDKVSRIFLK